MSFNSLTPGAAKKSGEIAKPHYDPRALLNPKAAAQRAATDAAAAKEDADIDADTPVGMGSMIERMHKIDKREDQPHKKRKTASDGDNANDAKAGNSAFHGGKGGVIGEYMKEKRMEGQGKMGPVVTEAVDLTNDNDDDDDIVITGENDASRNANRQVCLGKLSSRINMDKVPHPSQKSSAFQGTKDMWPAIKVSLKKQPGPDAVILVHDCEYMLCGRVDYTAAGTLSQMLVGAGITGFRIHGFIEPRKRAKESHPGDSVSQAHALSIYVYAKMASADKIGDFLKRRGLMLFHPNIVEKGIEIYNPHYPKASLYKPIRFGRNTDSTFVSRTTEEVRLDVQNMFDTLTKTESMPEMEPVALIKTPLLDHQKQALHFMSKRERDDDWRGDDSVSSSIWTVKYKDNGQRTWVNVITGNEQKTRPESVLGGILADVMGLGKTLSVLTLLCGSLDEAAIFHENRPRHSTIERNSRATLVICPKSVVTNWGEQIAAHVEDNKLSVCYYLGTGRTQDVDELARYDVVVTTYTTAAFEFQRKQRNALQKINWFRIVLDEAHTIRNPSTTAAKACFALTAQRRWALTGTPVQNRLDDLGALMAFLKIKPFDNPQAFVQFILAPCKDGDPEIIPKLRLLVASVTLRRNKDRVDLPPREEITDGLDFDEEERNLYEAFAQDSRQKLSGKDTHKINYANVLRSISRLRLICVHGAELL
ncbi:hypothetical protein LTR66_013130, partial [Elasticomyces elasticus]